MGGGKNVRSKRRIDMAWKRCGHCGGVRSVTRFAAKQRKIGRRLLDGEIPLTDEVVKWRTICKNCEDRRSRIRHGIQTVDDCAAEMKALLWVDQRPLEANWPTTENRD